MVQHGKNGKTKRLFDENAYLVKHDANVIECKKTKDDRYMLVLDETAFFPEGGGQPSDRGVIISKESGVSAPITDVQEIDGIIYHITEVFIPCGEVYCEIDFGLRYERMRNHSGEHLLSGFAHSLYGCTNVGFHLNDEEVTVDFDIKLMTEQLDEIERYVNRVIAENTDIVSYYPNQETLANLEYRSKLELTENVRIVEIKGVSGCEIYDRCACCAPHVRRTSEIGMLLITDSINYKGGTRLTMVCGKNAFRIAKQTYSDAKAISSALSSKVSELYNAVERLFDKNTELRIMNSALMNAYMETKLSVLSETEGDMVLFDSVFDRSYMQRFVDKAVILCGGKCIGFSGSDDSGWSYVIRSDTHDLKAELKEINTKINGRGGGTSAMIQGSTPLSESELRKIFE